MDSRGCLFSFLYSEHSFQCCLCDSNNVWSKQRSPVSEIYHIKYSYSDSINDAAQQMGWIVEDRTFRATICTRVHIAERGSGPVNNWVDDVSE